MKPLALALVATPFVLALASCTLYFENDDDRVDWDDDVPLGPQPPDPDEPLPPDDGAPVLIRCEDGVLRKGAFGWHDTTPNHGVGPEVGRCAGSCKAASAVCATATDCNAAAIEVCTAAPAGAPASPLEGEACSPGETVASPAATRCGQSVPGATCGCTAGALACTEATPIAATHAAMVGKWRGTAQTSFDGRAYPVGLWIYPDGSYWAETAGFEPAFYYGFNGPHPDLRFQLLSVDPVAGAYGDLTSWVSDPTGQVSALVVTPTQLSFTYHAAWHNCAQPITFDLTRED